MNAERLAEKIAKILKDLGEDEMKATAKAVVEIIKREGPVYGNQRRKRG